MITVFSKKMNVALLNPYTSDHPEVVESELDNQGVSTTVVAFDRHGNYLACGANDGRVLVWDCVTRSAARELCGHVQPITALSHGRATRSACCRRRSTGPCACGSSPSRQGRRHDAMSGADRARVFASARRLCSSSVRCSCRRNSSPTTSGCQSRAIGRITASVVNACVAAA
jgi:WD40 repeat protein